MTETSSLEFKSRAEYLRYCRERAIFLRAEYKPWLQLLRATEVVHCTVNGIKRVAYRPGDLMGCVAVVTALGAGSGRLLVGASFCNPRDSHRFDRHEAAYKALTSLREVPADFDSSASCDAPASIPFTGTTTPEKVQWYFYRRLPQSCRAKVREMLLKIRDQQAAARG